MLPSFHIKEELAAPYLIALYTKAYEVATG